MRITIFFLITILLLFGNSYAQTNPGDKELMDSLLKNDEMLKMLNDYGKTSSYFRVNVGFGNKLYSDQNKAIETLQSTNPFIISPSIAYNHKSGLGLSLTAFLFRQNGSNQFYQYTLSPFYNYTSGKNINLLLSYTHYFEKDKFSANTSPIQDEFYGKILFKKNWLKPGVSVGYSSGEYDEIVKIDTVLRVRQLHIKYTDTTSTNISAYSLTASLEHSFEFYNLLSAKDGLILTPQFSLISGINNYAVKHSSTLENYNAFTKKALKRIRHFQARSADNDKYQLQSLGLDLDINYGIGKFYFEPELYLDYYLPKTSDRRFTQIFNFNVGITF